MKSKQRSILSHIKQVLAIGLFILVAFLEIASVISIQKALLIDTKQELKLEVDGQNKYIDSWLSKKIEETELISESFIALSSFTDDEVQQILTNYAALDSDILNYYLCRAGIEYVVYNGGIFELDPTGRSWWGDAWSAKATIVTDAYVDANSGTIVVSVATPFYLDGVEAVILADISLDALINTIQNVEDKNLEVFLAGEDATIIAHKDAKMCMQPDGSSTKLADVYNADWTNTEVQSIKNKDGDKYYLALSKMEKTGWIVGAYLPSSYMVNRIVKAVLFILFVAIIVCIGGILYFNYMLKKQLAPMTEMKGFVEEVVVGKENIGEYKDEKDEIAFLISELKNRFVETIRKTKIEMESIDDDIQNTSHSVGAIVDAVNGISGVIEETAASMDTQTNNILSISNDCSVISHASIAVAGQAQEMAEKSHEIVAKVDELTAQMHSDKEASINSCKESQIKLEEAIKEAECINEITNISDAIRTIASQTNLLSLNASIESARAGEAGRGFAVVAEEIRSLSDETNVEINKIGELAERLLKAVHTLSNESTKSMDGLSKDIERAYETAGRLADEYVESANYFSSVSADLGASSQELSASVQTVAESVEDISSSQNEVNTAMENASREIQVVAGDATTVRNKVESVSYAVEEVTQTVKQFNL